MKKTALLILLALSVFTLAACSKGETAEETTAAETTKSASESLAEELVGSGTTDADAINAIIEALEVTMPDSLGTIDSLGQYTGLELTATEHVVITDEDVEDYINENIISGYTEEVTDAIKEGDTANIDYEGKKDGVAFDGGTSEGYDLEIGSGSFIDGFESGLIGHKAGETVDLNLTFPEDYSSEELAGQDVVFTVKINSVTRPRELDDELAKEISEEYQTADALRKAVKDVLQDEQDLEEKQELYAAAIDAVLENSEVTASDEAIEYTTNSYMKNYATQVENSYGIDLGTLLNMYSYSIEDFMDSYKEYAEESVNQRIALQEIAKKENISVTQEDIDAFAEDYGYDTESLIEKVGEELVNQLVLEDKANKFIVDNSNVTYTSEDAE